MSLQTNSYSELIEQIGNLLRLARQNAAQKVNSILLNTYWEMGRYIVEFEQKGNEKAEYGTELFNRLSKDLTNAYGKGFSRSNLVYMRKLYLTFQKSETLSHKLTWSHYFEILKAEHELEIGFYCKQAEKENWTVRELKRQMRSMLFHRLALSSDKEGILKLATDGHEVQKPEDLMKDPFVLEFLNIPEKHQYLESDLEENEADDNEPIGIILGAYKDQILVEYATDSITNKILLAKYQLYLPDKTQLQNALNDMLEI